MDDAGPAARSTVLFEVKYSFITQYKNAYPISLQCQVLGVSRNGYYQYRKNREGQPKDPVRQEMIEWVQFIAKSSNDTYGSRPDGGPRAG